MSSTDPQVPAPGPDDPWRKPETGGADGAPPHQGGSAPASGTPGYPTQPTSGYPTQPTAAYPTQPIPGYPTQPTAGYPAPTSPGAVAPYAPGAAYPTQGDTPQYAGPGYAPAYGGYGYASYGYPKNSYGVWALVLGILSLVSCGFLTGIPAIIVGNNAKKAAAVGEANNPGMATAGVVTGWIGTALSAVGLVVYVLWIVFAVAMVATTPTT